jgi:hypothetical protein
LTKMGYTTELFLQATFKSGRNVAVRQAEEMEDWAKENAPWTDRTGAARDGLKGWVDYRSGPIGTIVLQHDPEVEHAIWLELSYQGRWSILQPAKDYWEPRIRRSMQNLVNLKLATFEEEE